MEKINRERGQDPHVDTANIDERLINVSILCEDLVDIGPQEVSQDRVGGSIGRMQEDHNATQGRHVGIRALYLSEGGLNKGREGDISSCPAHRYEDKHASNAPGVNSIVGWILCEWAGRTQMMSKAKVSKCRNGMRVGAKVVVRSTNMAPKSSPKLEPQTIICCSMENQRDNWDQKWLSPHKKSQALCVWRSQAGWRFQDSNDRRLEGR